MVLKRIGVLSCSKILGILYALLGLIFGGIFSIVSIFGAIVGRASGSSDDMLGVLFGIGAVVLFPIFYGVMGFVAGLIMSALYNFVAGVVGGIEFEFE